MARLSNATDRKRRGFTLAESLMAAVVLALAVAGIGSSLSAGYSQTSQMQYQSTAVALARELMEEIVAKPFVDPVNGSTTLGAAGSRGTFNNIGDYHNYSDTTTNLKTVGGQTLSVGNGQTYTRTVTVEYRTAPNGVDAASGDFAMVTVTVRDPKGRSVALQTLASNCPWKF